MDLVAPTDMDDHCLLTSLGLHPYPRIGETVLGGRGQDMREGRGNSGERRNQNRVFRH